MSRCLVVGVRSAAAGAARTCGGELAFSVSKNEVSSRIPTVGVVEWSLAGAAPATAKIVYTLKDAASSILNRGGRPRSTSASPTIEPCSSASSSPGTTRSTSRPRATERPASARTTPSPPRAASRRAPAVTVTVARADEREPGFIVTSSGTFVPDQRLHHRCRRRNRLVRRRPPESHARADGLRGRDNLWMVGLNLDNVGGEMRSVSMDGEQEQRERRRARKSRTTTSR